MADVVATFGADTTEFSAAIKAMAVESGLLKSQIQAATVPAKQQMESLSGSIKHMGHEVTASARAFHHLAFAPVMIGGIAFEFYKLGSELHELWEEMGTDGVENAQKFISALDMVGRPREELAALDKKIEEVSARLDTARRLAGNAVGRAILETNLGKAIDLEPGKLEEEKDRLVRAREGKAKAVEEMQDRAFRKQLDMQSFEEQSLDIQKERLDGKGREAAMDQARLNIARETYKVTHDETLSVKQRAELLDRINARGEAEAALAGREFDRRAFQRSPSEITAGGFNSRLGGGVFGVGDSSGENSGPAAPIVKKQNVTNQKLDKIDQTLKLIHEDYLRSIGAGGTFH